MKVSNPRSLVEEVRAKNDIVDVIGRRIELSRTFKGLCPFHDERVPSFSVNPSGQYYHCFGCGAGGDVFDFVMRYEDKSFMEALLELAGQAGIPMSHPTAQERKQFEEERSIEDVLTESARFYHESLRAEAKDYLTKERGFTEEMIDHFRIGYAVGGLKEHLTGKSGFPLDLCITAGVLKRTEDGLVKDYFYKRIIFPNIRRGRVVHLSSRSLDGHEPKYLHLPGEIRYLYNEDAIASNKVYIAEGIPDCITAVQSGYPTVAVLGTSGFTRDDVPKFSRCETVYLCLDGDVAGREAAVKIGGMIGEKARIVQLPDRLDLNDFFRSYTVDDFEKLIASSQDVIKYELSLIPSDTDKTELPERLEPILKQLAHMDRVKAEAYLNYEIKPRFKLSKRDMDGYRELVSKCKEAPAQAEQKDNEVQYTAILDCLVDLVDDNGSPAFLVTGADGPSIVHQIEIDRTTYIPPPKEQIPWRLPRGEEVLIHYEQQQSHADMKADGILFDDLVHHHKSISELPSDDYYDLIAAWILHTYLQETTQYTPIICLFAVPERGKSRTGKGMIYIAYRGIHVESLRDAYLLRAAHDLHATIFFDVKDIWGKAEKSGSEDILLHRYERGAKVPRVLYPDRGPHKDTVYYSVFGPTVIGTNEGVHRILETRAIQICMPETSKRFENDVTPEAALGLKERLVAFRARHLGTSFPAANKPASGRLGDILKPLQQIIRLVKPGKEPSFLQLVKILEDERLMEKADSLEAEILAAVISLEDEIEKGMLPVKRITDELNEDRPERSKVSYHRVGWRLKAMGFQKAKTGKGSSAILFDEEKISGMERAYGLKKTPETSETPELPVEDSGDSGVSGNSDVLSGVCEGDSTPF